MIKRLTTLLRLLRGELGVVWGCGVAELLDGQSCERQSNQKDEGDEEHGGPFSTI